LHCLAGQHCNKIHNNGKVINKNAYPAVGLSRKWEKDLLGLGWPKPGMGFPGQHKREPELTPKALR
jgi:hypothetical protein